MRHLHARRQRFGLSRDQPLKARFAPGHESVGGTLADDSFQLLLVAGGFGDEPRVLSLVLRRLADDGPRGVVACSPGSPRDLMKLAGAQLPHARAVELRECGEQHGADGHVDADAERVRAADHPQQPLLGELLDEAPIFRQHPGVMHADAGPHQPRQRAPEAGRESESPDRVRDRIPLLAGGHLDAGERLGSLESCGLSEVNDVDRRLTGSQQILHGLLHRSGLVVVVQRHRAIDAGDDRGIARGAPREVGREVGDIAEGRRHEQELHARQGEQWHLPGPPTLWVGVEVELVHYDLAHRAVGAVAEGDVGEDLRGAADDGRIRVHRRIAGDHPHVLGAEDLDQGEELLRHQCFDRGGVKAAVPLRQRGEVSARRNKRLPGAGRGGENHVRPRDQLDQSIRLRRIQREPTPLGPPLERRVGRIRIPFPIDRLEESGHRFSHAGAAASLPTTPRERSSRSRLRAIRRARSRWGRSTRNRRSSCPT